MDVELILSTVLAIATVCYTIINLMMWFESRATRKQKNTTSYSILKNDRRPFNIMCSYKKHWRRMC